MSLETAEQQLDFLPDGDDDAIDDLSDEQINELLVDAERRLRSAQGKELQALTNQNAIQKILQLNPGDVPQPYINSTGAIAHVDQSRLLHLQGKDLVTGPRPVEDPVVVKQKLKKERKATAGPDWFDLPRTNLTPQLKRDLQLLRMRGVLDPKRHYKKEGTSKKSLYPEYSQVGTVVEGSTEFFSARIPNKERKKTFVDEVLAGEESSGKFKRQYAEVQATKRSGKKEHYKKLKEKRSHIGKNS